MGSDKGTLSVQPRLHSNTTSTVLSDTNEQTRTEKSQSSHVKEGEVLHIVEGGPTRKAKRGKPMVGSDKGCGGTIRCL
jgi:hypothetical protein